MYLSLIYLIVVLAVDRRTNDEKMIDEFHHVIVVLTTMKIPVRHIMSIMAEARVMHATMTWHQSKYFQIHLKHFTQFHCFFFRFA